ncbi:FAD/NAD(P)-binding domain-containing protein [Mycena galericulata]|nr:FAD/NAD(P)-binding domain-containing protein [Mycena galericulata]
MRGNRHFPFGFQNTGLLDSLGPIVTHGGCNYKTSLPNTHFHPTQLCYRPTSITPAMNPEETLAVATNWLAGLSGAVDADAFASHFLPTGWLRDLLCFSWDFRTMAGRIKIADFLSDQSVGGKSRFEHTGLYDFQIETKSTLNSPATFPVPGNPHILGVSAAFTFSTTSPPGKGHGFFRIVPDEGGEWKAYTLLTNLQDLVGHEEPVERPIGYLEGITWEEMYANKIAEIENDPTVLIVGGGQAGLMCAARFGRMGIRVLVIEKNKRVGDVWRNRLFLPNGICSTSLTIRFKSKSFPRFVPKEKVADFLEAYAVGQEIHVWLSSVVLPTPTYDSSIGRWTVQIDRAGGLVSVTPKHIVIATGNGKARIPEWPGMDSFAGPLYHSDDHKGAAPFKGKRVIVVGACNAGADICQDFVLKGAAEVTMVQRGATCVISAKTADKFLFSLTSSERVPIEDTDFVGQSMPYSLTLKLATGGGTQRLKDSDQNLHNDLTKAGFSLKWELTPGGGEVGFLGFFLDRTASGTMLDVGCGQLIIDGKIKIKQGVEVEKVVSDGLVLKDGSKLEADVIVLATGNEPIIANAVAIFGEGIKEKIGSRIWGLDEEGELTRCYRPTGAPGLWFAPGAFQHSRFFSKHLAIQILAQELGLKA